MNYTDSAFNTRDGQKALTDLAQRNGLALDGTPIIRTASEKDPTKGGIAADQFLFTPRRADGSALVPSILDNFVSLQSNGCWAQC